MPTLFLATPDQQLRGELSKITKKPVEEQAALIEKLQPTFHHSISWVDGPGDLHYNCVQYAFDLIDLPDRICLEVDCGYGKNQAPGTGIAPRSNPRNPLDTLFVNFLIERNALEKLSDAESEGVIVYLKNKTVKHVGKIEGEHIHSKWGGLGNLWQHGVYEVPENYGDHGPRFKRVDKNETLRHLSAFMGEIRNADTTRKRKRLHTSLHHPWP